METHYYVLLSTLEQGDTFLLGGLKFVVQLHYRTLHFTDAKLLSTDSKIDDSYSFPSYIQVIKL